MQPRRIQELANNRGNRGNADNRGNAEPAQDLHNRLIAVAENANNRGNRGNADNRGNAGPAQDLHNRLIAVAENANNRGNADNRGNRGNADNRGNARPERYLEELPLDRNQPPRENLAVQGQPRNRNMEELFAANGIFQPPRENLAVQGQPRNRNMEELFAANGIFQPLRENLAVQGQPLDRNEPPHRNQPPRENLAVQGQPPVQENVELSEKTIKELFSIIDDNNNKRIDLEELSVLFRNYLISPTNGTKLKIENWGLNVLQNQFFIDYFNRYDTDHDGSININEFKRMCKDFHRNLKIAINEFSGFQLVETKPQVVGKMDEELRIITGETPISNGVTLDSILINLKSVSLRELAREIGASPAQRVFNEQDNNACLEVHREIKKMIKLDKAIDNLLRLVGTDINIGLPRIFQEFNDNLLYGIDLYLSRQYHSEGPIYTKTGLILLINHLLTHPHEGLQPQMQAFKIGNKPNLSLSRVMFLINSYLNKIKPFGRAGKILHLWYVMSYLNLAVSGYGHTIQTFIDNSGRALPGNHFKTGCGPGNADRVLLALRTSISTGLNKISTDSKINEAGRKKAPPKAKAEAPKARAASPPRAATNDEAFMSVLRSLLAQGVEYNEAIIRAHDIIAPPRGRAAASPPRGRAAASSPRADDEEFMSVLRSLLEEGYSDEDAFIEAGRITAARAAASPPRAIPRAIPRAPAPAPAQGPPACFPPYNGRMSPTLANQRKLMKYLDNYRTSQTRTLNGFKKVLCEIAESNSEDILEEPAVFLQMMATELYAPGTGSMGDNTNLVDANDLDDPNCDLWKTRLEGGRPNTTLLTQGGRKTKNRKNNKNKKNKKNKRNTKKNNF